MAEPVKTLLLKAIADAIEAVPIVGSVKRNPPTPPRRETAVFPVVYIYDDTENKTRRNRYAIGVFTVQIEIYYQAEEEDASDKADLVDCEIHKAIVENAEIRQFIIEDMRYEEGASVTKQFPDEFTGVVVSRYVVKYAHAWGDPTNQAKNT